jgi:polysaccharide pyruvyl transferase CsaB
LKAVVSGYFGFGNLGDEAIRQVIEVELPKIGIEPVFLAKNKVKENEINRTNPIKIFKAVQNSDVTISGGGGLLQDKTSSRSLYYYLSLIYLPKLFGKKSVVFAQGIGPLKNERNRKLTKEILNKIDLITVRDLESKKILEEIGVKKEIHVTQDLAFLYQPKNLKKIEFNEPYNVLQVKGGEPVDIEELSDIARFMHYKTENETLIVPFYKDVDLNIAKEIEARTKFKVFIPENIDDVLSILNGAEIVVGMRYHSVVFSTMLEKPVLPVYYDDKVRNISKLFELDGIEISELRLSEFSKVFLKFIREKDLFANKIHEKLIKAKNDAKRNFDLLIQFIH